MRIVQHVILAAAVSVCLLALSAPVSAATFSVNPTQIFLAGRATSSLVTVRNDSKDVLRFQLSAFSWKQSPEGEIVLESTQDVVFFPALLTLQPGEERNIRVGSVVAPAASEKTYRIFVEELPPPATAADAAGVRVLTKMGIPIFIRPAKETATASLEDVGMREGVLHFTVNNTGTVHFVPQAVTVRGVATDGQQVFEQQLPAWYILSGGTRTFDLAVAAGDCARTNSLTVEVGLGTASLKESVQTPGGACRQ